jgi:hypothetical protein
MSAAFFMVISCLTYSSILKMETTASFETSVDFPRNRGRYVQSDRCENLKSECPLTFAFGFHGNDITTNTAALRLSTCRLENVYLTHLFLHREHRGCTCKKPGISVKGCLALKAILVFCGLPPTPLVATLWSVE